MAYDINAIRREQLGMNMSTARARLVKMLLFRELQRSGNDVCFHCGNKIDTIGDLSIAHKKPWMNVDPELFWDLDNVEFGHIRCNTEEATPRRLAAVSLSRKTRNESLAVAGLAWCSKHQDYIPMSHFTRDKNKYNGVQDICRDCRSAYRSPKL
jgi:hypothetical protein